MKQTTADNHGTTRQNDSSAKRSTKSRASGPRLPEASREAKRIAACILEVLAGASSPTQAAVALDVSASILPLGTASHRGTRRRLRAAIRPNHLTQARSRYPAASAGTCPTRLQPIPDAAACGTTYHWTFPSTHAN
jgi:hypothetical protein